MSLIAAVHAAVLEHASSGQPLTHTEFLTHVETPLRQALDTNHALSNCCARIHGALRHSPRSGVALRQLADEACAPPTPSTKGGPL